MSTKVQSATSFQPSRIESFARQHQREILIGAAVIGGVAVVIILLVFLSRKGGGGGGNDAGCIPIYWGSDNVTDYIPKNCFIDFRDFKNREEVYRYIKSMSKATYEEYLNNIRAFIKSERAQIFSPAYFEQTILEAILR